MPTPPGVQGKGSNLLNFLQLAESLGVIAAVTVDADLKSIAPRWMRNLVDPVLRDGADFVFPIYRTSQLGPLTSTICYPLVYGLFAADVRQPIGGDFALSGSLVSRLRRTEPPPAARSYGIDIFMTTEAIVAGAHLCGVDLGYKLHRRRAWTSIGPLAAEVVATLLHQVGRHLNHLRERHSVYHPAHRADRWDLPPMPPPQVDAEALAQASLSGIRRYRPLYAEALPGKLVAELRRMAAAGLVELSPAQWCDLLYALICRHVDRAAGHASVPEAVIPLFFGRLASWLRERATPGYRGDEDCIRSQAEVFFQRRSRVLRA